MRFAPLTLLVATPVFAQDLSIKHQTFKLDNGLTVVVHEDHSDPVVSVYVQYHVGSAREERGRSGFAHLFEHMLFQGSEHVGDDQHFKLVQGAGGTLNGSTTNDRTNYFETLPSNQLELALWLESDRMGFLLPAMTQAKLDNQRDVVKNERRQNYENRPYAQGEGVILAALYPADHPYSWETIGSQEDLTAATLDDVKKFFQTWYVPSNATLAIGGDVEFETVKKLVTKYFQGIDAGTPVAPPVARPTQVAQSKRLVTEDRVKLPQLQLVWPTVETNHADEAALDLLAAVLASSKWSVLDRALSIDTELARRVSANSETQELAGTFSITLSPNPGTTLDTLAEKTRALLAKTAADGIDPAALARAKTVYEARLVRRLETVATRTSMLGSNQCFTNDPNHHVESMKRLLAVTPADVQRVLKEYVINRPCLELSTVPMGKQDLAATAPSAERLAKEVARPARTDIDASKAIAPAVAWPGPATTFDRKAQPASGAAPTFRSPKLWHGELANGVATIGTIWREAPFTTLTLSVPAGRRYETREQTGLASLTAQMLSEGTISLSTTELAARFDELGATFSVSANDDEITFVLSCLDKNLDAATQVLGDVLLHPRFAANDFERKKKDRLVAIQTRGDNISGIAGQVFRRLVWGPGRYQGAPAQGTEATVKAFTLADVQEFWRTHATPRGARLVHVGAQDAAGVKQLFGKLATDWKAPANVAAVSASAPKEIPAPQVFQTGLYLVDKPGAAQSEIRIGHLGIAANDPAYYPLVIVNYALGGSFSSRINLNLREAHGYSYGARSAVETSLTPGAFMASAPVKTDDTKASIVELMKELKGINGGLNADELKFAQDAITQSAATQYESTRALADYVDNVSRLGWPEDYTARRLKQLASFTLAESKATAEKWIHADRVLIVVVGDKAKILPGLKELGYGDVIELDIDGEPITAEASAAPGASSAPASGTGR